MMDFSVLVLTAMLIWIVGVVVWGIKYAGFRGIGFWSLLMVITMGSLSIFVSYEFLTAAYIWDPALYQEKIGSPQPDDMQLWVIYLIGWITFCSVIPVFIKVMDFRTLQRAKVGS